MTLLPWGMPHADLPKALRWYHHRWAKPRRRLDLPSSSWNGWEGQAIYSARLDLPSTVESGRDELSTDVVVTYVGINDKILTLDACIVRLEIHTNPFSHAYVLSTDVLLGPIKEGVFLHSNTLSSRTENFSIVERNRYRVVPVRPFATMCICCCSTRTVSLLRRGQRYGCILDLMLISDWREQRCRG